MNQETPGQLTADEVREVRKLLDIQAIQNVMLRYVRCLDRLEPVEMETIFWPEGTDNHGNFDGPAKDYFAKTLENPINALTVYHLLGPARVDFVGDDQAKVESYFLFTCTSDTEEGYDGVETDVAARGPVFAEMRGRYRDLFEKRDGEWRILRRTVIYDTGTTQPYRPDWAWFGVAESGINHAGFHDTDAIYHAVW